MRVTSAIAAAALISLAVTAGEDAAEQQLGAVELIVWWVLAIVGLSGSAMYSGLETGVYSLNRVRLHILDHQGRPAARKLRRLVDHPTTLISTLLIGNNVANYAGTASLAVILENMNLTDAQVIVTNALIVTPMLFVFGETLPKDLFARYSDRLMYRFVFVLLYSKAVFTWTGVLPLVNAFGQLAAKLLHTSQFTSTYHPKRQVGVLVKEGVGHGLLSEEQSAIVERVLALGERRIEDEMVPWSKVITVKVSDSPEVLWQLADRSSVSRYPVLAADGSVAGVVNVYDVLLQDRAHCPPVGELLQPAEMFDKRVPASGALSKLQTSKVALAIVTDGKKPVGVVTIKDLIEPITGELASW